MIGKTIREYKILSEIGEGGMGAVYLAEHSVLGKFAIKALAPQLIRNQQFRERFVVEAKAQFGLKHDNIVHLHTFMEEGENLFLVMEYMDGDPLDKLIEKRGRLSEKEALRIFKDVLRGLNYAHSKGVVHRDIKPSNIMLTKNGVAKVMDFGIALMAGGKRMTKTGTTMGTAHYMSPEQISRPKDVDHRTDVYAMGIILYEMLTGKTPFDGNLDSDYEIYEKHIKEPPPDIRTIINISPELAAIVMKALEKNPDDRFNGCGEFLEYIEASENESKEIISEPQKNYVRKAELIKTGHTKVYDENDLFKKGLELIKQFRNDEGIQYIIGAAKAGHNEAQEYLNQAAKSGQKEAIVFKNNSVTPIFSGTGKLSDEMELASRGQRFGNFFLDILFFYILIFLSGILLAIIEQDDLLLNLDETILFLIFHFLYYIPQEALFGKTIGKRITGTKAVKEDGTELSFSQALGRTFCRLIPFEPFSFLGGSGSPKGWHDRIPKTKVISLKRKSI